MFVLFLGRLFLSDKIFFYVCIFIYLVNNHVGVLIMFINHVKFIESLHFINGICPDFVLASHTLTLHEKLERESVLRVRGQEGCGDGGHQAGDLCWFVPGEMTSQSLSALLFS